MTVRTQQPGRHTAWQQQVPRQYIDFMSPRRPTWLSHFMKWPLALPSQCLVCHAWPCADVLCTLCMSGFSTQAVRCTGCTLALSGLGPSQPRCGNCLRAPPAWNSACAWVDYSFPWAPLITRWKFGQQATLAQHFARWMQQAPSIQQLLRQVDLIIPIPLSATRLRERGYNPAAQLARSLHPQLYQPHLLQRVRHTLPQSGLSRSQRLRNLHQAFEVPAAHHALLAGKTLLLVDDVMTTGATFTAASRCLMQLGVEEIHVLCMARTP